MNTKTYLNLRKWIIVIIVLFSLYILGLAYIKSHELIHRTIYSRYGIGSATKIDYLTLSGTTLILSDKDCNDSCKLQNTLNDVIGYYLVIFIMNSWLLLFIFKIKWNKRQS